MTNVTLKLPYSDSGDVAKLLLVQGRVRLFSMLLVGAQMRDSIQKHQRALVSLGANVP